MRVLGVSVGKITDIDAGDQSVRVTMQVDDSVDVPADAKAVIIAQSLVSARFVQLTPVYSGGEEIADDATIPMERTASPVEWDEIKEELMRLSEALGPEELDPQLPRTVHRHRCGESRRQWSDDQQHTSGTLRHDEDAVGRSNRSVRHRPQPADLRVGALAEQRADRAVRRPLGIRVECTGRSSDQLGVSLTDLNVAVGDVQRFVQDNRAGLTESVQRLADATEVLARKRPEIERVLHSGPTALSNFYNIYKPAQGSLTGALAINNAANPIEWMCGSVGAAANATSERSEELCRQQLGPVLSSIQANYLPVLSNPLAGVQAFPDQIEYSEPGLEEASAGRGTAPEQPAMPASPLDGLIQGMPDISVPGDLGSLLQPGGGR